jgi:nucleotide-binding universal stress UspA family protein
MRKILIGYDGSARGDDALALGRLFADADPGGEPRVAVVTIYAAIEPSDWLGVPSEAELRQRREADLMLQTARDLWPQLDRSSFVPIRASSPSAGLQRCAVDEGFEVIVVGTSHRHRLGRAWAGSVTEQTLLGAPRAVAVAPPGYAAATGGLPWLRRIGVAYDGSVEARHALTAAAELAVAAGAETEVVVASVLDTAVPPFTGGYGYGSFIEDQRERGELDLRGAAAQLAARGVERVVTEQPVGDPAHELCALSSELDLLLLGSRGHGPAQRLLLGSVSTRVVRDAACPLLLHPRSARDEQGVAEIARDAIPAQV